MNNKSSFPYGAITSIKGECLYLKGNDIDTDRIIPARYLKCINFEALGSQVFADDRNEKNGLHPFDQKENSNASILIVDKNFGCGSSREHAPQALMRWGIRAIVGQSFAEIFHSNCLSIGIPCAIISEYNLKPLLNIINAKKNLNFTLDLESQTLYSRENKSWQIQIEQSALEMLKSGKWDATSMLINEKEKIDSLKSKIPYINNFQ